MRPSSVSTASRRDLGRRTLGAAASNRYQFCFVRDLYMVAIFRGGTSPPANAKILQLTRQTAYYLANGRTARRPSTARRVGKCNHGRTLAAAWPPSRDPRAVAVRRRRFLVRRLPARCPRTPPLR